MKYRVCWRSNLTGTTRWGMYMEKSLAEAWLAEGRAKFPSLEYWLEDEAGSTPATSPQAR